MNKRKETSDDVKVYYVKDRDMTGMGRRTQYTSLVRRPSLKAGARSIFALNAGHSVIIS